MYIQHQEYFRTEGTDREPSQAFQEDLQKAIQGWTQAGEKVVLYMDANQDVRAGPLNAKLL